MLNEIAHKIVISYSLIYLGLNEIYWTHCSAFWEEYMNRFLGIGARWDLIQYHLLDQSFCVSLKIAFFPQILFMMTVFFYLQDTVKAGASGACDLVEIYQINIFYAALSSEVNQEVTLIYLTTHWLCFCQCIMFSYRRISNGFFNVSLNSFCGSAVCLWAVLDFGAVKSTSLTRCKVVNLKTQSLFIVEWNCIFVLLYVFVFRSAVYNLFSVSWLSDFINVFVSMNGSLVCSFIIHIQIRLTLLKAHRMYHDNWYSH